MILKVSSMAHASSHNGHHNPSHIRNFSIIAHIDHGKSTLSDRILEQTGTVSARDMQEQLLDTMDIERERGITIKSQAVRVNYTSDDGETYEFNLIDTPGHVDFTYEVSRSLAACEGAVLVVDATQGVEAQTVANAMMAMNANLEIIPLINKIDLPASDPDRAREQIEDGLAIPADDAVLCSAKTGEGVHDLLEAIVYNIPAPVGDFDAPLRALIFDSYFDPYRGVVALVRVVDGTVKKGDTIYMMATGTETLVEEVGARKPAEIALPDLSVGDVGYLVTGLKDVAQVKVGDTITMKARRAIEPLPGYRDVKPMVFTGELELLCSIFKGKTFTYMTPLEAEITKYCHNVFGAYKVTYFNAVYDYCRRMGADWARVHAGMLLSGYINDTHTFVPGPDGQFGYGGKCFPKDVNAFAKLTQGTPLGTLLAPLHGLNMRFRGYEEHI